MKISKQGQSLRFELVNSLKLIDSKYQSASSVEQAVERLALARTLHLLFNDPSQILYSQLLLSQQYFLLSSYDLSEIYALQILDKDQSFDHRLRADIVLLKIKAQTDNEDNVISAIEKIKKKYEETESWKDNVVLDVAKVQAKIFKKVNDYDKSILILKDTIQYLKKKGKQNSLQHAELLLENAHSYFMKQDYLKASAQQKQAITIQEVYFKKDSHQRLVKMYLNLAKYEEKQGAVEDQFKSLKKAQQIYRMKNYQSDKITVDIKKKICQNLEKREKNKEAMKEFELLKQLINQKYGSFSMQMADTKKRLGKIYEKMDKKNEGKNGLYLAMLEYSEAANIYSENKEKKHMEECRGAMYRIKPHRLQIYKSIPAI